MRLPQRALLLDAARRRRENASPPPNAIDLLTGLVDWWRSGEGLSSTDALDSWTGSINGHVLLGDTTHRPSRDTSDTLDSPRWPVSGANLYLDLAGWAPASFDHTVTICCKTPVVNSGGIESVLAGGSGQNFVFFDSVGAQWFVNSPAGTNRITTSRTIETVRAVLTFVVGRTYSAIWRNGALVAEATHAAAAVSTPDTWRLGWISGGTAGLYDYCGNMHDAVLVDGLSSAEEIQASHAFLQELREVA